MPKRTITGRIATTDRVPKYGEWRLTRDVLEEFAERVQNDELPMLFEHDAAHPIAAVWVSSEVVALDNGEYALDATFEVVESDWEVVQAKWAEHGVPGGFSFTATTEQAPPASGEAPVVVLAADAAAWSDADRAEAAALLDEVVPTATARLFQYSAAVEAATVFIISGVGIGVLGNATYDALKRLILRREGASTRIEFHRRESDGSTVKAIVTTSDPEVAKAALETLPSPQPSPLVIYDRERELWRDR
jgi:hypothetical protein